MHGVPQFYLYGEPHRAVGRHFLHLERLDDRSRPNAWTIRVHAHADLVQLLLVEAGGGEMAVDGRTIRFRGPALLAVPRAVAHGFAWEAESIGWVLTLSCGYLDELVARFPALAPLFAGASATELPRPQADAAAAALAGLSRELGRFAPAGGAAVEAGLLAILVQALRERAGAAAGQAAAPGKAAALVARYRERIEERFRRREQVAEHAAALGVSVSALRAACARVAAMSPAAMLDERALLEAKRALVYSNLSVAEVGYAIGFADPAYFSRFFARHAGRPPAAYRCAPGRTGFDTD